MCKARASDESKMHETRVSDEPTWIMLNSSGKAYNTADSPRKLPRGMPMFLTVEGRGRDANSPNNPQLPQPLVEATSTVHHSLKTHNSTQPAKSTRSVHPAECGPQYLLMLPTLTHCRSLQDPKSTDYLDLATQKHLQTQHTAL